MPPQYEQGKKKRGIQLLYCVDDYLCRRNCGLPFQLLQLLWLLFNEN